LIALGEFGAGFLLAIEELHDAHAGDVFLEERIDSGDGGADVAIGVAYVMTEDESDDQNARKHRESVQSEPPINLEKHGGHDREKEEIVDHGNDASGEKIV